MKTVDRDILLDWWLEKYHKTNCKEVIAKHPKEVLSSPDWFKLYPVTQEQEDEWIAWAKAYIKRSLRISDAFLERQWPYIYLDCSPYVNDNNE